MTGYPKGTLGYEREKIMERFYALREEFRALLPRWVRWIVPRTPEDQR